MPFDETNAFNDNTVFVRKDFQDAPAFASIVSGKYQYGIVSLNVHGSAKDKDQSTSGARDTIFMYCLSRSSRATGPNMRVPRGSCFSSSRTTALSSNRM